MTSRKSAPKDTRTSRVLALANRGKKSEVHAIFEGALRRWEQKEAGGDEQWESCPLPQNKVVSLTA